MSHPSANPLRRQDMRSETGLAEIKGLLTYKAPRSATGEPQEHMPFIVFNISDHGLGLWVSNKIDRGSQVTVTIAKPWLLVLRCEVRWCHEAIAKENEPAGFMIGVHVLDQIQRLESLHRSLNIKAADPKNLT